MSETIFLIIGGGVIAFLTGLAVWQARRVSARIAEFRNEEAQGPRDPYAQMAALAELTDKARGKKPRGKKPRA